MRKRNCTTEESSILKRCGRCQINKPLTEFGFEKSRGKHRTYCYNCRMVRPSSPRTDIKDRKDKLCPRCKEVKSIVEFRKHGEGENREAKTWHYCRPRNTAVCRKRMRKRIASGEARAEYKEVYKTRRWKRLLDQYGITQDDYEVLESEQQFKCAICKKPETRMYKDVVCRTVVDHDHKTKRIRGLLCYACNLVLRYARDNIDTLSSAIDYLREQQKEG